MASRLSARATLKGQFLVATIALLCLPVATGAAEIRIGGTGNALGTMRLVGEAYGRVRPDTKVKVLDSIGSSGAIRAIPKGALEIGLVSRTLNDEEVRSGLVAIEYARTPTVFAVQEKNKTTTLTLSQIADIYNARMTTWADGSLIRPVIRQPGDDNTKQIKALSADLSNAVSYAEGRPGLAFAVTDQEAADKMESVQGSFGVTTLALIRSEKRGLRPLAIGGVAPTPENAASGRYPLLKHFYFVLPKNPSASIQDFLRFVKSPAGIEILQQNGHTLP